MKYKAIITRVADGEIGEYKPDWDYEVTEDGFSNEYIWSEGNFSCDCNRMMFFHEARGEEYPVEKFEDIKCSNGKFHVRCVDVDTGAVLYDDDNPNMVYTGRDST